MTADLVARLEADANEIVADWHRSMGLPLPDSVRQRVDLLREAASALRSSGEAVGFVDGSRLHTLKEGRLNIALWSERGSNADTPLYLRPATPASAWRPIAEAQPPAGRMDLWLVSDDNGDYLALARRSSQGWRVDGAGDWKLPFTPTQYCKPPTPPTSTKQPAASAALER